MRPDFIAVTGATTTGKTAVSIALAERMGGEIVSMDSRQVYRGMDIGTDKVDPAEFGAVPHHGLDLCSPNERFSAGRWGRYARECIRGIHMRGRVPILVGGTGFFLKTLIEPIFVEPPMDSERRERLMALLDGLDADALARWVHHLDPERAPAAIPGGPQRMKRTIEVALLTGRPLSWWHVHALIEAEPLGGLVVILERDREEIDRRVALRVDRMVERGLLDEVRGLLDAGYGRDAPGMKGHGYREIAAHLAGETSLEDALESMRAQTRQYARRQMTWFRHQAPDDALRLDAGRPMGELLQAVLDAWHERTDPNAEATPRP